MWKQMQKNKQLQKQIFEHNNSMQLAEGRRDSDRKIEIKA